MFSDLSTQALELSLVGASQRGRALQANLANLNTPGYQRVDVDFHGVLNKAFKELEAGQPLNLDATQANFSPKADLSSPMRADGNTVDIDQESTAIAENALEYQAITTLLGLRRRNLETVIRSNL